MRTAMASEKHHLNTIQLANSQTIRWDAEWRIQRDLFNRFESIDRVQTTTTDHTNASVLKRGIEGGHGFKRCTLTLILLACLRSFFAFGALTTVLMKTDAGQIKLEMFDQDAPNTVANFVKLAREGFYDGLAFHRVIDGFMAQGGCPNSREGAKGMPGTGGPGYTINCEINSKKHAPGILSMAHAGKNTGGSQFFIVHEAQPHLDGVHTVFGQTGDMDVVLALKNGSRIESVTVTD
jgi:peptidyl-prolyl cis-trans isomerase B (cyclophilin B)